MPTTVDRALTINNAVATASTYRARKEERLWQQWENHLSNTFAAEAAEQSAFYDGLVSTAYRYARVAMKRFRLAKSAEFNLIAFYG